MYKFNRSIILSVLISIMLMANTVVVFGEKASNTDNQAENKENKQETIQHFEKLPTQNYVEKVKAQVPEIVGTSAVLIDAKTGAVIYEKNMNEVKSPASTTKILTAILVLENLDLKQKVVADLETAYTGGSRIYLMEGEKLKVDQLMYAMLVSSANDAAVALAKTVSETTDEFALLMNDKAREIGTKNSNFVNPNGLDEENHKSTAYDIAMIARYAMTNEDFRRYVSTVRYQIPATNLQEEIRYLKSTNKLLYDKDSYVDINGEKRAIKYEGITGIKTGYTTEAGGCLVSSAKRGETELISVVLQSNKKDRFKDSIKLLDWGFANYETRKVFEKGEKIGNIEVKKGEEKEVAVAPLSDIYITAPKDNKEKLNKVLKVEKSLVAPVEKGKYVGVMDVFAGDKLVASVPVETYKKVIETNIVKIIVKFFKYNKIFHWILTILAGIFAVIAIFVMVARHINLKKRKKKRKEMALKIAKERLEKEKSSNKWRRMK